MEELWNDFARIVKWTGFIALYKLTSWREFSLSAPHRKKNKIMLLLSSRAAQCPLKLPQYGRSPLGEPDQARVQPCRGDAEDRGVWFCFAPGWVILTGGHPCTSWTTRQISASWDVFPSASKSLCLQWIPHSELNKTKLRIWFSFKLSYCHLAASVGRNHTSWETRMLLSCMRLSLLSLGPTGS